MSYDETKNFVEKIMRSRWWKSRMPNVRHLKLKDGRGTRYARGGRYGFRGIVLNIPRWARHPLVILHEMAHTMTPPNHITPSHGPTFCANNLDLIKRWINKDAWLEMKALYKSHKVKFRREKKGQ
jgi:putative metallohydrolase (TIGR04338 family)